MASSDKATTDAERQRAKALAQWEGEGGTFGQPPQTLDEAELRILSRLGAALLCEWEQIPDAARESIAQLASTLHAQRDAERIRVGIKHFLDERKEP